MKEREGKGPVQKIASGLLGFFQLKDQGNPGVLLDAIRPTLDLQSWYFNTSSEIPAQVGVATVAPAASGYLPFTVGDLLVPQNEWWHVDNFTVYCALPLGTDTAQFAPGMRHTTTNQDFILGEPSLSITGANRAQAAIAKDFWLPPGSRLGLFAMSIASATNLTVLGACRFTRLPI